MNPTHSTPESPSFRTLLVEDDAAFAVMVTQIITQQGGSITHCPNLAQAQKTIQNQSFDLVLLDNHLPDGKAYDFFHKIASLNPNAPILMITGQPDLHEAIALTRNGLFDYLTKPVEMPKLVASIQRAKIRIQHANPPSASTANPTIGQSPAMQVVLKKLQQASLHPLATVLLTGESGTGKDVAARTLHLLTTKNPGNPTNYVAVNCAALPAEMFESELFGAERGAYTGADKRRQGLVAAAQGGTLFLDEIAEVPLALQAKLLRFLENREYRPLGSTHSETFSGRLVAATNKNLHEQVLAGTFRQDLLYRLEVITIPLPPLRDRISDLPDLTEHLLQQLAEKYGRSTPILRAEDLQRLTHYSFPGNIRELRNLLERALLHTDPSQSWLALDPSWLVQPNTPFSTSASTSPLFSQSPTPQPPSSPNSPLPPERHDLSPLEEQEYRLIQQTLQQNRGAIRKTATQLGLSPQALLRRLEKWPELRP